MATPRIGSHLYPACLRPGAARALRIIGVGLLAIALQACSAVRLGYNKSPEIAYWWLDSYLDFDNAQSRDVRASLEQIQA